MIFNDDEPIFAPETQDDSSGPSSRTKVRIINKTEAPLKETKFKVTLKLMGNEFYNEEPRLNLVIVLDVSRRMEKVKIAMQSMIKELSPCDNLSIITLTQNGEHEFEWSDELFVDKVNNLEATGPGNISNGLKMGLQVLNRRGNRGCMVAIMLLSDSGQTFMSRDATRVEFGNVPIYTFFLGTNPKPLKSLVEHNSSGGTFTHVQNRDNLSEKLSLSLARLLAVAVQDLKVTFKQVHSAIKNVSAGNYPQYRDDEDSSVTVSFGNLNKKELHMVNVDLLLPDVCSTQCAHILEISYTYRSFEEQLIHTNPLFVTITRRNSAPMINEAREITDKQLEVANKMIIEAQKLLEKGVDETLNSEVQQLKRLMNSQKPYNKQESEEVTIDEILATPECGEGTIRSLEASTVDINNDVKKFPIEFLLDRTVVRQRIPESLNRSNNYEDWSAKVKKDLEELNLWKVIEEPPTEIAESIENVDTCTAIQKLRQFRENWMALIFINQACGFPINLQIIDLDSAKAAWETLDTNWKKGGSYVESFLSAVECGNWKKAECLLDFSPNNELATTRISSSQSTILHLASLAGEVNIVKKLVLLMKEEDLEIKDKDGYTALANASIHGNTRIAKCIISKHEKLVSIPTGTELLPVVIAVMHNNKQMASYLYSITPQADLTNKGNINGVTLLTYSIRRQFYGVPVQDSDWDNNDTRLSFPAAGYRGKGIWQQIASRLLAVLGIKRIYEMKLVHHRSPRLLNLICQQIKDDLDNDEINGIINALHEAATNGVVEFIVGVLKKFPEFRWLRDKEGSTIFMKAVQFRQADVFGLIHEFPSKHKMVVLVDKRGENILHKLQYGSVDKINTLQGGLIKIQREIKWLEEIKSMMPLDSLKKKNNKKKTAQELIDASHKRLIINAEKGMKETANSCIIVGILVVTIMFAAAFTVPGGNNQDTGLPLFLKKKLFKIFIISDAVSLCFSTVSVFMFLGILTSRYAENDFLKPLPTKLIIAISTLFISLTAMMVAFTATLFLMLREEFWISIPITVVLTSLPVILFALSFFPLLSECVRSTFGPSIFNRRSKLLLIG